MEHASILATPQDNPLGWHSWLGSGRESPWCADGTPASGTRRFPAARLPHDSPPPADVLAAARTLAAASFRLGVREAPLVIEYLGSTVCWTMAAAADAELTSVLIPVRGAHRCLRLALSCLARHTGRRTEVIVACALAEVPGVVEAWHAAGPWPPFITGRVVTSEEAQGYPANVNLARMAARGAWLVFLNSDAYVGPAWDATLFDGFSAFDVVAVGPAGQLRIADVEERDDGPRVVADVTSEVFRQLTGSGDERFSGPRDTGRLVGFCLAVRSWAFDAVGGVCERYGIGNFDDDDFSLKLRFVGRLVTVPRFVAHGVSASFRALPNASVVYEEALRDNGRLFDERWGWIAPRLPVVPMETFCVEVNS